MLLQQRFWLDGEHRAARSWAVRKVKKTAIGDVQKTDNTGEPVRRSLVLQHGAKYAVRDKGVPVKECATHVKITRNTYKRCILFLYDVEQS